MVMKTTQALSGPPSQTEEEKPNQADVILSRVNDKRIFAGASALMVSRIVSISSTFISIGMLTRFLSKEEFGAWAVLISFSQLLYMMDLGVGAATRNKVSALLAAKDLDGVRRYLAAVSVVMTLISGSVFGLFLLIVGTPETLLGVPMGEPYATCTLIVIGVTIATMGVGVHTQNFNSFMESHVLAVVESLRAVAQVLMLAAILYAGGGLIWCVATFYGVAIPVTIFYVIYFYRRRQWRFPRPWVRPWHKIRLSFSLTGSLARTAGMFGLLQAGALLNSNMDSIIVSKILSLEDAGRYNVLMRMFAAVLGLHATFLQGYWSAYALKYQQGEFAWMRSMLRKVNTITFGMWVLGVAGAMTLGPTVLEWWTGYLIYDRWLYVGICGWSLVIGLNNHMSIMLNSINKTGRQALVLAIGVCLNIPLALFFGHRYGLFGIFLATLVPLTISALNNFFQLTGVLRRAERPA